MRAGVHDRLQARRPEQLGRRQGLQHRRREHLSCDDAVAAEWHASATRLYRRHLDRRERDLDPVYRPGACLSGPLTTSQREETNMNCPGAKRPLSRLLKKSFASTGKDGVVAVVEGQLDLDRAVVLEF